MTYEISIVTYPSFPEVEDLSILEALDLLILEVLDLLILEVLDPSFSPPPSGEKVARDHKTCCEEDLT